MTKECTTHHHACDCREKMFADQIAELEAKLENAEAFGQWQTHALDRERKENEKLQQVKKAAEALYDAWGGGDPKETTDAAHKLGRALWESVR